MLGCRALIGLMGLVTTLPSYATESLFYVYPVQTVEGVSREGLQKRASVDPQFLQLFTPYALEALAKELADKLTSSTIAVFPSSTVSGIQVSDSIKGAYQYGASGCDAGFRSPIKKTYAITLSLVRASVYVVNRDGVVEVLVPTTLSIQVVKPDEAKIITSLSDTLYSPFKFSAEEYKSDGAFKQISSAVAENLKSQVPELVKRLAEKFNPKMATVSVLGNDGPLVFVDRGFESGFVKGDEPVGVSMEEGKQQEYVFRVVHAGSGYAVLLGLEDRRRIPPRMSFVFDRSADDSSKPRLMPLIGESSEFQDQNIAADYFLSNIGTSSAFQVVPVNPNFTSTIQSAVAQAPCVSWTKFPATSMIKESRGDSPNFVLDLGLHSSEVYRNSTSGVKSEEEFSVIATARLVDSYLRVHFSELVVEKYKLERVGGQGLQTANAIEVAKKNAILKLSEVFARNAKLESVSLRIQGVEGDLIRVKGENVPPEGVSEFVVEREVDLELNGRKLRYQLEATKGKESPYLKDGFLMIPFSVASGDTPRPRAGDTVRLIGLPKPGSKTFSRCDGPAYMSPGSIISSNIAPLYVENAFVNLPNVQFLETSPQFRESVTKLFDAGLYKAVPRSPKAMEIRCLNSGFAMKLEKSECKDQRCQISLINGLVAKIRTESGDPNIQAVQRTLLGNVLEPKLHAFIDYQSQELFLGLMNGLKVKLQEVKF